MKQALWQKKPQADDLAHAGEYLSLLLAPGAAAALARKFRKAKIGFHPAKNILRASGLTPLDAGNARVAADLKKIAHGKTLGPVLLVRGDAARGLPLVVADGYHRLSAAWHAAEAMPVACCIVDRKRD